MTARTRTLLAALLYVLALLVVSLMGLGALKGFLATSLPGIAIYAYMAGECGSFRWMFE